MLLSGHLRCVWALTTFLPAETWCTTSPSWPTSSSDSSGSIPSYHRYVRHSRLLTFRDREVGFVSRQSSVRSKRTPHSCQQGTLGEWFVGDGIVSFMCPD